MGYFIHFLPVTYFKTAVIPATNAHISESLMWEEFLRFWGLLFLMAMTQGNAQRDYWANDSPQMFSGAPYRLHMYMSKRRFDSILKHLTFTLQAPPPFKSPFHQVQELIAAFNAHTPTCFSPGWISCLDESMSPWWTSRWTRPGWMFVPCKPHPMGNKYHSMCCGLSGIMYAIELVEGKDRPRELGPKNATKKVPQSHFFLRLTASIAHSERVVIMDSGFCVLQALTALSSVGIFSSAVI